MALSLLVEGHGERPLRDFLVCLTPRLNPRASGCKSISVRLVISLVGAGCDHQGRCGWVESVYLAVVHFRSCRRYDIKAHRPREGKSQRHNFLFAYSGLSLMVYSILFLFSS